VQLARWAGAEVIGTGRSHSRELVTELGASRFIALDTDRLEDVADQADLVFDTHSSGTTTVLPAPGNHSRGPTVGLPASGTQRARG
jgi:NADPH:quinone reductase-like Zn-dependent oxidoreductase